MASLTTRLLSQRLQNGLQLLLPQGQHQSTSLGHCTYFYLLLGLTESRLNCLFYIFPVTCYLTTLFKTCIKHLMLIMCWLCLDFLCEAALVRALCWGLEGREEEEHRDRRRTERRREVGLMLERQRNNTPVPGNSQPPQWLRRDPLSKGTYSVGQTLPIERNGILIKMSERFSHCCSSENTELKSSKFCRLD